MSSTVTIDGTDIGGDALTCLSAFLAVKRALESGDEDFFVHAEGAEGGTFTLVRLHLGVTLTARIVDDGTIGRTRDLLVGRAGLLLRDLDV